MKALFDSTEIEDELNNKSKCSRSSAMPSTQLSVIMREKIRTTSVYELDASTAAGGMASLGASLTTLTSSHER
jgi:hypothetical protein